MSDNCHENAKCVSVCEMQFATVYDDFTSLFRCFYLSVYVALEM